MIVYVPQDVYDRLQERLKNIPEKIPDTLKKTVNSTAKEVEKDWRKEIKRTYTLKHSEKRVKGVMTTEKATNRHPQATIEIRDGSLPLYEFQRRKNTIKAAVKAKVLRSGNLKKLEIVKDGQVLKAFVQTIKNTKKDGSQGEDHVGIFQRFSKSERDRKGLKWNAIKQLYGPPVPGMAGNDDILSVMREEITKSMRENLEKHIAEVMGGL